MNAQNFIMAYLHGVMATRLILADGFTQSQACAAADLVENDQHTCQAKREHESGCSNIDANAHDVNGDFR